ncbi:SRPBCC family protein [Kordia zhangzhouensis]|uniref:orotate phosphoribosyltransferase n=1 Tax=Kordia zhangzhouensis TaxID=1620405 RepID=UPI000629B406|nr:orotate phosphoribosyltransferase [Kordia zhangzhouensis]
MNIESPKVTVHKSPQELYDFLTNVENFEKLMPENISKFEVLEEGKFLFALKGMPEIVLKLKESTPPNTVVLGAASDKLPFTLTGNIQEIETGKSEAQLVFEGSFNPMMAMMIKGPIGKFVNTLAENMSNL